jgi:hypothetical protein
MPRFDTRHRRGIDHIVLGTEQVDRYLLSWDEAGPAGRIRCSLGVPSRTLARRIVEELFMADDNVTKINLTPVS